jgi:hypothetical protein
MIQMLPSSTRTFISLLIPFIALRAIDGYTETVRVQAPSGDYKQHTAVLQNALDSGADSVIVSADGGDWDVDPLLLNSSNQVVLFERGVVVRARKGGFHGRGDQLFEFPKGSHHITLTGYGAALKMRKSDYQSDSYTPSEWRHCIKIARNDIHDIAIYGLSLDSSGGDGIEIGAPGVKDVLIKDVWADANHRQGISVLQAENLLIEDCIFSNTDGTAPFCGLDVEPYEPWPVVNFVMRRCRFFGNKAHGIKLYLNNLDESPVSMRFEDCYLLDLIETKNIEPDGPEGGVVFSRCLVDLDEHELRFTKLAAGKATCTFDQCIVRTLSDRGPPIQFSEAYTPVVFTNSFVQDARDRAFLEAHADVDISGTITVANPHGARISGATLGRLTVTEEKTWIEPTVIVRAAAHVAAEDGEPGTFVVSRMGGNGDVPLGVVYSISGTATAGPAAGVDYGYMPGFVMIEGGESEARVEVRALRDNSREENETVVLTIEPRKGYYRVGGASSATVLLSDDGAIVGTRPQYSMHGNGVPGPGNAAAAGFLDLAGRQVNRQAPRRGVVVRRCEQTKLMLRE